MINSACVTYSYNNHLGLQNLNASAHYFPVEVNLNYCDTKNLFGICNREIKTLANVDHLHSPLKIYAAESPFHIESKKIGYFEELFASSKCEWQESQDEKGNRYSKKYEILEGFLSKRGTIREQTEDFEQNKVELKETFYTGCFDWNAAIDGDEHVRSVASYLHDYSISIEEFYQAAHKATSFKPSSPAFLSINNKV